MLVKEAIKIIGSDLGKTSKMPGYSWGISAKKCVTGSKLAKIQGTICSKCYALKGFYSYNNVTKSHKNRLQNFKNLSWVEAMASLILKKNEEYFRWFDSGDLQSHEMLDKIIEVCKLTPKVKHWLPTKEAVLLTTYTKEIPSNLTIRLSATKINGAPPTSWPLTSTVHFETLPRNSWICPASNQDNQCKSCRACWDSQRKNISYKQH